MTKHKRPDALDKHRTGETVFSETSPHTTPLPPLQRHHDPRKPRLRRWRVNRWLGVELLEVSDG
jgi:hypothetical protein